VGVRGARIKNIVDELAGERIDIVRWNDSLDILVPNALQPAEVEDVVLCPMLGKVIGLVRDDQLSLAIGKKGQNVRLASKLVGWDIHVMTQDMLAEQLDVSVAAFSKVDGVTDDLADSLVSQGFFTFDDLSVIEPDQLAELGELTPEQCDAIIEFADEESLRIEQEEKRAREENRRMEAAGLNKPPATPAASTAPKPAAEDAPPAKEEESAPAEEEQAAAEEPANSENETPVNEEEVAAPAADATASESTADDSAEDEEVKTADTAE
jgi:N utilization substance protein A